MPATDWLSRKHEPVATEPMNEVLTGTVGTTLGLGEVPMVQACAVGMAVALGSVVIVATFYDLVLAFDSRQRYAKFAVDFLDGVGLSGSQLPSLASSNYIFSSWSRGGCRAYLIYEAADRDRQWCCV